MEWEGRPFFLQYRLQPAPPEMEGGALKLFRGAAYPLRILIRVGNCRTM